MNIPTLMTAVHLERQGGQLITKQVPVPKPGPDEVLIKMAAAPINPSDIARIKKKSNDIDALSFIPGIEGSGTVVATGSGLLPKLWMGKRVACTAKYNTSGTWAEYMVTSASLSFPLSKRISDEQASMALVNPLTAIAFFDIVNRNKHKAVINTAAASALGRIIELLSNKYKIPLINIVYNKNQFEQLRASGSKYVLNSSDALFKNSLHVLANQLNATLFLDAVGGPQLNEIINLLPNNSSVVIYGNLSNAEHVTFNPMALISNNITIAGFYLANSAKENGLVKNIINVMRVNRLLKNDLKIKVRNRFPLHKVQEALDYYLDNMSAGKVLFVPSS